MIDFITYMSQCGWQGIDEFELEATMAQLWATPEYYGKYKTVEELLCHPYEAISFCRNYELKLGIHTELDEYTLLHHLLNLRKRKFLLPFEKGYESIL